jgi:hypothetical protein
MIKPLHNDIYHNKAGRWDIEVDIEDEPTGEDKKCDILYYKIKGPKEEVFTYKIRYTGKPITLPGPDPGNLDQADLQRRAALFLVRHLIKGGRHTDLVASHLGKKWAFRKPAEPLIKHSEAKPVSSPAPT